ncbi:hypothetical protein GJA_1336 [Janthinobacterium agaricidamnosum NBRC 102515 = DSM 9628]|uniref:Uncharacterized protein n=1 Tax=Janthinobacterium agaricidamnosum NBRC 102515 = DSM 9628 TaxID=1349767 RepID=W0V3S1_9BURK|nr:hypothetical protein GJA_1336 [Janthinobacterium agaricidamnosum NBRC 102515 = DSM 9628]
MIVDFYSKSNNVGLTTNWYYFMINLRLILLVCCFFAAIPNFLAALRDLETENTV